MILFVANPTLALTIQGRIGACVIDTIEDTQEAVMVLDDDRGDIAGVVIFWNTETTPSVVTAVLGKRKHPALIILDHGFGHSIPPEWRRYVIHINNKDDVDRAIKEIADR